MLTRRNIIIGTVLLSLVVIAGWFFFLRGGGDAVSYRTAEARVEDLETVVSAVGKVQPKDFVDVGAQVSGQLQRISVEAGDTVEEGQLLAEIDPTLLQARVEESRAQLESLDATLAQRQADLALARGRAERNRRLLALDAISQQETEATDAAFEIAKAQLAQLRANIRQTQSTLNANLANLDYTRIYAPMAGTVVSIEAAEGQTLNANQTAPLIMRIADLSTMTVEADVSETDVTQLDAGMEAYFNTLGRPDERYDTTLRQVLPQPEIVNDVVLYKALLDIDNEAGTLLPDMSAQVFFVTGRAEDAVTVPVAALRARAPGGPRGGQRPAGGEGTMAGRGGGARIASANAAERDDTRGASPEREALMRALDEARNDHPGAEMGTLLVMEGGEPRQRPVLVGLRTRVSAEIIAGLEAGEIVVTGIDNPQAEQGPQRGGFRYRG